MIARARTGALGDRMELAEVEATETMAKECRSPEDYALWRMVGRYAVEAARKMTREQRAVFAATVERAIADASEGARTNTSHRLQQALGFATTARPEYGFEDKDD